MRLPFCTIWLFCLQFFLYIFLFLTEFLLTTNNSVKFFMWSLLLEIYVFFSMSMSITMIWNKMITMMKRQNRNALINFPFLTSLWSRMCLLLYKGNYSLCVRAVRNHVTLYLKLQCFPSCMTFIHLYFRYFKAGGLPEQVVDLLSSHYQAMAQTANLLAEWLILAGKLAAFLLTSAISSSGV